MEESKPSDVYGSNAALKPPDDSINPTPPTKPADDARVSKPPTKPPDDPRVSFASDDPNLLPCDIYLDFPFRGAYRGLNVPGALAHGTIIAPPDSFMPLAFPRSGAGENNQ